MLFRDLIPEEEFIVGEMVYSTMRRSNILLEYSKPTKPYGLRCRDFAWYSTNGLRYNSFNDNIIKYDTAEDWFKDIITNNMERIIPIKYKPI